MMFKIINRKYNDYFIVKGNSIEEIKQIAEKERKKRGWKQEDLYSVEL